MARTCGWSQSALTTSRPPLTKFGPGFGEGLAVFEGNDSCKFVELIFQKVFQLEEVLNALTGRCAAPSWKGIDSGLDSSIDVGRCREGGARQHLRRSGVGNVYVLGRGRSLPGAIHVVLEFGYLGGYGTAHTQLLGLDAEWRKYPARPTL